MLRLSRLTILLLPAILLGQGTDLGSIRGTVTDLATDSRITVKTSQSGEYEATSLRSGAYKVNVAAPGFGTQEISGITLGAGATARANARLEVARSTESVMVESVAPLI